MNKLKTEQEKEVASKIVCWLKDKPRSFQVAALNFLHELCALQERKDGE